MPIQSIGTVTPALRPTGVNAAGNAPSSEKSFGQFLTDALEQVNDFQRKADQASTDLATGRIDDISQVVIAAEKATIALQLTIQVRNKMLESYQEMMRMSV